MSARQQLARVLPLVLLLVLILAGVRGIVTAPRWTGPLKADGVVIGIVVEVLFAALLEITLRREGKARRAAEKLPYTAVRPDIEPAQALRFTLKWVLGTCLIAVPIVVLADLHLHFFGKSTPAKLPAGVQGKPPTLPPPHPGHAAHGGGISIPLGPILYGLLIAALVAAVAVSIWWSTRGRRPAQGRIVADTTAADLREAVSEGRAALAAIEDARAAIIACYAAMERSLAANGAARAIADTPDELLARAATAGLTLGTAAGRLTALFYEARYSRHPLTAGQRDEASAALDELAAQLSTPAAPQPPGDRPAGDRPAGDRPAGDRPAGDRA